MDKNVIIFSPNTQIYEGEEVDVYGFAFTDFYCKGMKISEIKIKIKIN